MGEGRGLGWVVVGPASPPVEDSLICRLLSLPFLPPYLLLWFSHTRWEVASGKPCVVAVKGGPHQKLSRWGKVSAKEMWVVLNLDWENVGGKGHAGVDGLGGGK